MNHGECRSCKARVVWARSVKTNKPMPLDRDDENGNGVLDGTGRVHVFRDHATAVAAIDTAPDEVGLDCSGHFYISHHATCPKRAEWRGKTRASQREPQHVQESLL